MHTPLVLLIFDGFGDSDQTEYNAIAEANTPCYDKLRQTAPHTLLNASGAAVGLPNAQMGNSEVGHMHIGAGRTIPQELTRISQAIETDALSKNPVLVETFTAIADQQQTLHLMGLLSPGGVHSHEQHLFALLRLAKQYGIKTCHLHLFLDGRDTPPKSAKASLEKLNTVCETLGIGTVKTVCGRYYAMDRDQRFERLQRAYDAITNGQTDYHAETALAALAAAYARGETDEFVQPTRIGAREPMQDQDALVFFNFRADRARQLSHALRDETYTGFKRERVPQFSHFITLTTYDSSLNARVIFPAESPAKTLGEVLSEHHLTQLRLAETEKYAHVTFFFNGGREKIFPGESRILIPSPKVATYDLKPEMSAEAVTDALVDAIKNQAFDVIICNYANADMVGHTGNYAATIQAIECLDHCLARILQALEKVNGELLLTADHGNAESMFDPTRKTPVTSHTCNLVPFIYYGRHATMSTAAASLIDIAPTLLHILGLPIPGEMCGKNLIRFAHEA